MTRRPRYLATWTLREHETLPGFVVAACITLQDRENRVRKAQGVIFLSWLDADNAADAINDAAALPDGIVIDPENASHALGFTDKVTIEGHRLYVPVKAPEGAVQQ